MKNSTSQQQIEEILQEAYKNGKFFSAIFIKQDGSERHMLCRCGVKKHRTGQGLKFDARDHRLLPVWDVQIKEYRLIGIDRITQLKINGETYVR